MTLRSAPPINLSRPPKVQAWDPDPALLEKWTPGLRAGPGRESVTGSRTISILDVIGAYGLTGEGVTARRIAAALRAITADEITVDLNSPGGDFFEGVAIYNMLRADPRRVTVRILGLAASAASVMLPAALLLTPQELEAGPGGDPLRAAFERLHAAQLDAVPVAEAAPEGGAPRLRGIVTRAGLLRSSLFVPNAGADGRLRVAAALGINGAVAERASVLLEAGVARARVPAPARLHRTGPGGGYLRRS